MSNKNTSVNNIYQLDGRVPIAKAVPFGLQHVLAMFVSNLAPISIIAAAETIGDSTAMVASGLNREIKDEEISGAIAMIIAGLLPPVGTFFADET